MPVLAIGGTTYAATRCDTAHEDLATYRRRFSGKLSSETRSADATAKQWEIETDYLTDTVADGLETTLYGTSAFNVSGDVIGATISVRAEDVVRQDGPLSDMSVLRFRLVQVDP